jgi:hypothetical protein
MRRGTVSVHQFLPCRAAFRTLSGTGTTTYTWPISVTTAFRSRTTVPFRRSTIVPAYRASILCSGIVPVPEVAVDELRRVRPCRTTTRSGRKPSSSVAVAVAPGQARDRKRHDRPLPLPRQRRRSVARLRRPDGRAAWPGSGRTTRTAAGPPRRRWRPWARREGWPTDGSAAPPTCWAVASPCPRRERAPRPECPRPRRTPAQRLNRWCTSGRWGVCTRSASDIPGSGSWRDASFVSRAGLSVHLDRALVPWYSSVATSSGSAPPRSIPMCQVQLKSTAFRSLAPGSGV